MNQTTNSQHHTKEGNMDNRKQTKTLEEEIMDKEIKAVEKTRLEAVFK